MLVRTREAFGRVPFASDGGGNTFFVDCSTREGAVYLWFHDTIHERIQPFTETLAEFVATIENIEVGKAD